MVRDSDNFSKGFADTTQDPVHNHNGKVIGENYPESGYGTRYVSGIRSGTYLSTDDYYLLKHGAPSPAPTRIDKASFTADLDLVSDVIKSSYDRSVGELASTVSGLKVSFDSNRTYTYSPFQDIGALIPYLSIRARPYGVHEWTFISQQGRSQARSRWLRYQ